MKLKKKNSPALTETIETLQIACAVHYHQHVYAQNLPKHFIQIEDEISLQVPFNNVLIFKKQLH